MVEKKDARGTSKMPIAELRARTEVARRALADAATLMEGADRAGNPADFASREEKALALIEEAGALVPTGEPLSEGERARLERELEDAPDEETMREIFRLAKRVLDDPSVPAHFKEELAKLDIDQQLATLDEIELMRPVARDAEALAAGRLSPKKDPLSTVIREEAERRASKLRS